MLTPLAQITATSSLTRTAPLDPVDGEEGTDPAVPRDQVDFDIRRDLGRTGTRSLDRAAGLAIHAVGQLDGLRDAEAPHPSTGLVMASTMGSIQTTMDFTRDTFVGAKPYHVDPAKFPNTVMNFAAGQCAIRYGIQGPNATVTAGHVGSLAALAYASRLLSAGHATRMVVASSEELSQARVTLERAAGGHPDLGEGAAALILEPSGAADSPVGEVIRLDCGFAYRPDQVEAVVITLIEGLLDCPTEAPRVKVFAPQDASPDSPEVRAMRSCFFSGEEGPVVIDTRAATGDVSSANGLLQIFAALAELRDTASGSDLDCAIVTSVDLEGAVHAALVRVGPAPTTSSAGSAPEGSGAELGATR